MALPTTQQYYDMNNAIKWQLWHDSISRVWKNAQLEMMKDPAWVNLLQRGYQAPPPQPQPQPQYQAQYHVPPQQYETNNGPDGAEEILLLMRGND